MRRVIWVFAILVALAGVACAGDGRPSATVTQPATTPGDAPDGEAASTPEASGSDGGVAGAIYKVFVGSRPTDSEAPPASDESLKQYLLTESDLPAGYHSMWESTYRVPDGFSIQREMDMASAGFTSPDADVPTTLISTVLEPDDMEEIRAALVLARGLNEEDLRESVARSRGNDRFQVKLLDAGGLGDNGFGMEMTMTWGELIGARAEGFGADRTPNAINTKTVTMRMYVFASGDRAGGMARMRYHDAPPDGVDDLTLAKIMARKLSGTP